MELHEQAISDVLKDWLEENGFDYDVEMGTEFCADLVNGIVVWAPLVTEASDGFYDYAKELGLRYDVGDFVVSFMHEVFHFETEDFFSEEEWEDYASAVADISCRKRSRENDETYYRLDIETAATQGAVDYINDNYSKICDLMGRLIPVFDEFYLYNLD